MPHAQRRLASFYEGRLTPGRRLLSGRHHSRDSLQVTFGVNVAPIFEHGFDLCFGGVANLHYEPAACSKRHLCLRNEPGIKFQSGWTSEDRDRRLMFAHFPLRLVRFIRSDVWRIRDDDVEVLAAFHVLSQQIALPEADSRY